MSHSQMEEDAARKKQALELEEEEKQRRSASPNAGLNPTIRCDSKQELDDLASAYNEMFGGKPGYKAPVVHADGNISFSFPNKGDAEGFCLSQAQQGRCMVVIDQQTMTVMGYSNGDGILYHADGQEFQEGNTLKPSHIADADFDLPEPRSKLGM